MKECGIAYDLYRFCFCCIQISVDSILIHFYGSACWIESGSRYLKKRETGQEYQDPDNLFFLKKRPLKKNGRIY